MQFSYISLFNLEIVFGCCSFYSWGFLISFSALPAFSTSSLALSWPADSLRLFFILLLAWNPYLCSVQLCISTKNCRNRRVAKLQYWCFWEPLRKDPLSWCYCCWYEQRCCERWMALTCQSCIVGFLIWNYQWPLDIIIRRDWGQIRSCPPVLPSTSTSTLCLSFFISTFWKFWRNHTLAF